MQISSSGESSSSDTLFSASPFAQARKAFLAVGSALESGDLSTAKTALADFQKNVPSRGDTNNPVARKIATLSQALESGNLSGAKTAFADATITLSNSSRGQGGTTTKVYDVRDANKDGRVSMKEELAYDATHILESTVIATDSSGTAKSGTMLDVLA